MYIFCEFQLNEKKLFEVKVPYSYGKEDQLTQDAALELAKSIPKFNEVINGRTIDYVRYNCEPFYKVGLDLTIKKKKMRPS